MVNLKPGYKTTEFWLALVGQLTGLFTLFSGLDVSPQAEGAVRAVGGAIVAIVALGYAISRGLTKKGALTNAALTVGTKV